MAQKKKKNAAPSSLSPTVCAPDPHAAVPEAHDEGANEAGGHGLARSTLGFGCFGSGAEKSTLLGVGRKVQKKQRIYEDCVALNF